MKADQVSDASSGKPISLPEPDTDNITVLTKELPNEPILPWHHYDSPWLEGEEKDRAESERKAKSDRTDKAKSDLTDAEEKTEGKAEGLLVELKEKIAAEIELLEDTEPQALGSELTGNIEEIAGLARELAAKLEAEQAITASVKAQAKKPDGEPETLLVELKEKIAAEIKFLECAEPQAQNAELSGNVQEIAILARELAAKLEAKQVGTAETRVQAAPETTEDQPDSRPQADLEDLIEERDEVE